MDSTRRWFLLLLLAAFVAFDLESVLAQDGGVEIANAGEEKLTELYVNPSHLESLQSGSDDLGAKLKERDSSSQDNEREISSRESEHDNVQALDAWLPPWLANLPARFQELTAIEWDEHGEPLVAFLAKEWGEHGEPVVAFLSKEWREHGEPVLAFLSKEWNEHGEPFVAFISKEWGEHGKPVTTFIFEKVSQVSASSQETVQEKWFPAVMKQWENAKVVLTPHIEAVKVKAGIEWDEHGKPVLKLVTEKMSKISAVAQPYFELFREKAKPYIKSTSSFYRPSFEKAHGVYQSLLKSSTTYHVQLQSSLQSGISKYGFLAALATKEIIWFLASALLLLPVLGIFIMLSSTRGGKSSDKSSQKLGGKRVGRY